MKHVKKDREGNRGANRDINSAGNEFSRSKVSEATNLLIRHHLTEFKDHFSDRNLEDILAKNFVQLVDGLDWEPHLMKCHNDRVLGSLIGAYYILIECSIWMDNQGPEGDIYKIARSHAVEVLKLLAQDIVHGMRDESEKVMCECLAPESEAAS